MRRAKNCRLCKPTCQKTTACAKQTAFTWIQKNSTDETCKQHEINQAQTDLCDGSVGCDCGGAARSIQQWNSREASDMGKTTRQKTTACAAQIKVGCANQPVRKQQHAQSKQHSHGTKQNQQMKHANNTK
jgi:hypothetical protein